MYEYKAAVIRVIDGDTIIMDVDLGFYVLVRLSCRLAGLNAIELNQPGGSQARTFLASLLPVGTMLIVKSIKPDKFAGRFDAIVWQSSTLTSINEQMIAAGYAVAWDGIGPRPVPIWPMP